MTDAHVVQLDRDHPGFRDLAYRARRDAIARLAREHRIGTPPPEVPYTPEEHLVWQTALEHLGPLHQRYACQSFLRCWPSFPTTRVPQFHEVNAVLSKDSGFSLSPVPGLVTPREFMEQLADGVFLATQYIRHHSAPLYTPEPDVIHELVGHVPLLLAPEFAAVNRLFGEATRVADAPTVERLIRVYWYTLEFGVARRSTGLEVLGAGLLSSFGELGRFETEAQLRPFDLEVIAATPFDPTDYQRVLFVGASTEAVLSSVTAWLRAVPGVR